MFYITDLIDGVLRVIERGEHLGIYHIGTDQEVSVSSGSAGEVGRCFGRDVEVIPGRLVPPGSTAPESLPRYHQNARPGIRTGGTPLGEHGLAETVAMVRSTK